MVRIVYILAVMEVVTISGSNEIPPPLDVTKPAGDADVQKAQKRWAQYLGIRTDYTNTVGMKMALIPPGRYLLGSTEASIDHILRVDSAIKRAELMHEVPQAEVKMSDPYYIGIHEVSIGQFRRFVNATRYTTEAENNEGGGGWNESALGFEGPKVEYSWRNAGFPQTDDHPVGNVTASDIDAFLEWLSKIEETIYRLPTEAEWEYACQGAATGVVWPQNEAERLVEIANCADAAAKAKLSRYVSVTFVRANDGFPFTAPIGSFRANSFGLYDMIGNVWERCEDEYQENPSVGTNPLGKHAMTTNVIRGGSATCSPSLCRAQYRSWTEVERAESLVGFRVVREIRLKKRP